METKRDTTSALGSELGEINDIDYKNFINTKYNGLITVLSDDTELVVTTRPLILAFHNFNKLGTQLEPWCNQIVETAEAYVGRVDFAVADFKSLTIASKWNKFNYELLGPKSQPRFFAFDLHGNQYRKDEFLKRQTLKEFALLLFKEQLLISEPLPQDDLNSRVQIAVGKNIRKLLKNCNKDIFIVFYINKNEISEELIAKLEELARLLQHEDLTIMKMNAVENHIPLDFNIVSYPRCFYIRKNDKNHYIQYEKEKYAIEHLIEFIAQYSTKELECCERNGMLKEELRFETELHLDSITHIRSVVKNNYNELIQVITKIEVTEKPIVVAFHNFMRFYDYLELWCDIIGEIARKFEGQLNFAIADISSFGIDGHKFNQDDFTAYACPLIFGFDKNGNQYNLKEFLSISSLSSFVENLLENKLSALNHSLVRETEALLKVGTKENFDELVSNGTKEVFILFYALWSYFHSNQLEVQDYLASLFQEDEHLVIVKIDADAEKPPPYHKVGVFPMYIYVPCTGSHIEYREWGNDVQSLIKFIAKTSKYDLKYYDREGFLKREYKRKSWIKPFQSILTVRDENTEEEIQYISKHKIGNIITSSAFEGLLVLRSILTE